MSDIIKLLPEHVANQIAAGEVIQRPASVVKELLDNAIDAGAGHIQLIVKEGGKTVIQVIDNGKGMSPTDARMCWERHATSKISTAEDIYGITTMGFRGEALASIASIAQVELKTKTAADKLGTLILVEGSEVKKQEQVAADDGTSITVKNLFYNIPARRNFLKSNPVETRHIFDEFTRAALANPHIGFTLYNNAEQIHALQSGTLQNRINELFSYTLPTHLITFEEQTTIAHISGYIGKPEYAKKTRGEQFFFVNNRFIKDAYLNHAVMSSYENIISKEQFPFYVINIAIDTKNIDVNVHPTKTEIKFDDERSIYQILKAIGKKAIGQHYHVPDTYVPSANDAFLNLQSPQNNTNKTVADNFRTPKQSFSSSTSADWQELFGILNKKETIADVASKRFEKLPDELAITDVALTKNISQIHGTFILSQVKSGVVLIDAQAAHERVLYDKYVFAMQNQPIACQQKLFPKPIVLSAADALLMHELLADIRALGFDMNDLGGNTFVVNGVPAELNHYNEQHLIDEILEHYKQENNKLTKHQQIAKILAQRAAVKPGTTLSYEEMNNLIDELFACADNKFSPTGRLCYKMLSIDAIYQIIAQL